MTQHSLSIALSAAALAASALSATAEMKYENQTGGSARLYGQVNPAILSVNDGDQTETNLVDNDASNTRVGLEVKQPYSAGDFAFKFETALGLPASSKFSQDFEPEWTWDRTRIRHVDFSLKSDWGKVSAGQGSMATDGVAQQDLSGTTLSTYVALNDTAGDFRFRNSDGTLSDITIDSVNADFDGARRGRIRYDTPSFGNGFNVGVSYGRDILSDSPNASEDEFYDIALRYARTFDGTVVNGALGYAMRDRFEGGETKDTIGSVSVLLTSGLNFTFAAGSRDEGGSYGYGKLGYKANWFGVGSTALAIDYYDGQDFNSGLVDDQFKSYGVGATQKFDDINLEAYLGYRNYDLSATGAEFDNIGSVILGGRWKF